MPRSLPVFAAGPLEPHVGRLPIFKLIFMEETNRIVEVRPQVSDGGGGGQGRRALSGPTPGRLACSTPLGPHSPVAVPQAIRSTVREGVRFVNQSFFPIVVWEQLQVEALFAGRASLTTAIPGMLEVG